jgi:hypothetical protein
MPLGTPDVDPIEFYKQNYAALGGKRGVPSSLTRPGGVTFEDRSALNGLRRARLAASGRLASPMARGMSWGARNAPMLGRIGAGGLGGAVGLGLTLGEQLAKFPIAQRAGAAVSNYLAPSPPTQLRYGQRRPAFSN